MKLKLPDSLASTEQLEGVIFELTEYLSWSEQAQIKAKVKHSKMSEAARAWSTELEEVLESWSEGKNLTLSSAQELLGELQAILKQAPPVHITLAAVPGLALRGQFVSWFRTEINPHALLSFTANRTILGGLVVRAGSHIYDFSWRKALLDKKDKLPELVSHVRQ